MKRVRTVTVKSAESVKRVRTINQAAAYLREKDPETPVTATTIRRLILDKKIPFSMVGRKYLIPLDGLEAYLEGTIPSEAAKPCEDTKGKIRPVDAKQPHGRRARR